MLELRRYTATPGNAAALADRFTERTLALFAELGFEVLWIGLDSTDPQTLIYTVRWDDEDAMARGWQQFAADPQWAAIKADTETDGPLYATIDRTFLTELPLAS